MEELRDVDAFGFVHPEDYPTSFKLFMELIRHPGKPVTSQIRSRYVDGTWHWIEATGTNLLKDPVVKGIVVNYRDITERRHFELALQESEARYHAVMQKSLEAIYVYDAESQHIVDANPAFMDLLGYSAEEVRSLRLYNIVAQERESIDNFLEKILSRGGVVMGERLWRRKDGTTVLMEVTGNRFQQGGKDMIFVIGRDISERKIAEEKIRRQLNYLTALREIDQTISSTFEVQSSLNSLISRAISLLVVDAATVLVLNLQTNSLEYAAGYGFRSEEVSLASVTIDASYAGRAVIEKRMLQIPNLANDPNNLFRTGFLQDEGFVSYYGVPLVVKGKAIGVLEVFQRTFIERGQEWFDFLTALAGQAAIAIDNARLWEQVQDYAKELEQRVAERTAELNQLNRELEHANHAKDEFLATMSHELRTPLNSILGLSETLLEQRRGSINGHQQKSLQLIEASGQHLLAMINDILDLSKIEAGKLDFYPEIIGVDEICQSSLNFVKSQAAKGSVTITYAKELDISKIYADPRRLKQILVNLLTNAVKFTAEHGQVTLQVHANAGRDLIQFSIIDNGIGIALEDLKLLFKPFVQLDSRRNREFEGTGLGLALVQRLTDLHGGSVQVESEVGKGSRFTVNLPWGKERVAQQEPIDSGHGLLTSPRVEKPDVLSETSASRGIILLAEDNLANILTIGEYLESYDYQVAVAHNGLEAIEKAQETNPDIILMDIQMPAMDGLEAIQHLRATPQFATTPIIALTALAMPGDRELCLKAGASEYMSKPVSLKSLLHIVNNLTAPKQ
jgi:PAS domain S-box-containing protein